MPAVNTKLVVSQISHRQQSLVTQGVSSYVWDPREGASLHVECMGDNTSVDVTLDGGYTPVVGDTLRLIVTSNGSYNKVVVNFNGWGFNEENSPVEFQYVGTSSKNPNWRRLSSFSSENYTSERARSSDVSYSVEFADSAVAKSDVATFFVKQLGTGHILTAATYVDASYQNTTLHMTAPSGSLFMALGSVITSLFIARGAFTNTAQTSVLVLGDTLSGSTAHARKYSLSTFDVEATAATPSFINMSCPPAGYGDGVIMASSGVTVYMSPDFGTTWYTVTAPAPVVAVAAYLTRFYYLTDAGELYTTTYSAPSTPTLVTTFSGTPFMGGLIVDFFGGVAFTSASTYFNASMPFGTWSDHPAQIPDLIAVSRNHYLRGVQSDGFLTLGSFSGWDCAYGKDVEPVRIQPLHPTYDFTFNTSMSAIPGGSQILTGDSCDASLGYNWIPDVSFNAVLRTVK